MGVYILDPVAWDFLTPGEAAADARPAGGDADGGPARSTASGRTATGSTSAGTTTTRRPTRSSRPVGPPSWASAEKPNLKIGTRPVSPLSLAPERRGGGLLAYLIGAIPFGYLIGPLGPGGSTSARSARGTSARPTSAGSSASATSCSSSPSTCSRGCCRRSGFPDAVRALGGRGLPELRVLVALATILGHNFPVYLASGGKGVATSLGALLALDPVASGAAVAAFVIFLLVTRYVSLSSLLGGLVFVVVHFARTDRPWDRDQRAMSLADARPAGVAGREASQEPGEDRGRDRAEGRHGPQEAGAAERPGRDGPPRRDRGRAPGRRPGDPGRSTPGIDGRALSAGRDGPGRHRASTRRARGVRRSRPAAGGHLPEVLPAGEGWGFGDRGEPAPLKGYYPGIGLTDLSFGPVLDAPGGIRQRYPLLVTPGRRERPPGFGGVRRVPPRLTTPSRTRGSCRGRRPAPWSAASVDRPGNTSRGPGACGCRGSASRWYRSPSERGVFTTAER